MYTQFFGNFLLNKGVLTSEQLLDALKEKATTKMKLGTLAIHEGMMTSNEVDNIVIMQTHQNKRFGELAVEDGYLTPEQLDFLLTQQVPDYLLLGQILIEKGILTNSQFENLIIDYQSENEIYDLDLHTEQHEVIQKMLQRFCTFDDPKLSERFSNYLELFFNNLIRFIGEDFTPLDPMPCSEYPAEYAVRQMIKGTTTVSSIIDIDEASAIGFASRYVGEPFVEFDEYVKASLEDFLNLHNGLFIVNISNEFSEDLSLTPPEVRTRNTSLPLEENTFLIPLIYPFGTVHFIISVNRN